MVLKQGVLQHSFTAMGTNVQIFVHAADGTDKAAEPAVAVAAVEALFRDQEARFSRFDPDSELMRLNRGADKWRTVSAEFWRVLDQAAAWNGMTGGIFDPAILPQLVAAGYDKDFSLLKAGPARPVGTVTAPQGCRFADIGLDPGTRAVYLPPGCALDLGGIVKGWTVDRAARLLARTFDNFLIDAGGDVYAQGEDGGRPWQVGVQHPLQADTSLGVVGLQDRAIATSTVTGRRWQEGDRWQHHLIDPRTGEPAVTDLLSVTIVGPTTTTAEIAAKTVLILGVGSGLAWLSQRPGTAGLLVTNEFVYASRGWRDLLCGTSFAQQES